MSKPEIDTLVKLYNRDINFKEIKRAAEDGSQYKLAPVYYNNKPDAQYYNHKTFYWYQKAAENGDIGAQYNLALSYKNGEGTEKDLEKAFYWYQKAAENGDIDAQYNLAFLCYKGEGTEKN